MMESIELQDPAIFREIFDISPYGVSIISKEGSYIDVNQNFATLLGYESKNDLVGKSIREVTHPDDFEQDYLMTEKIFSGEVDYFELEKRFIKKNGDVVWLKLQARTYQKSLGIGILEPIKEREELEIKIAKLKKDLDQFIYRISHDFRTPVLNILALTSMDCQDKEDAIGLIEKAKESANQLDYIIREIADYAKYKKFSLRKDLVDLEQLLKSVCEHSQKIKDNRLQITVERNQCDDVHILIDESRLSIVLSRLIENALDFGVENGEIQLDVQVRESTLFIEIEDNGVGIRQDVQAKIFDMFYRGSNLSKGSGLGLFIVKDIVKELDGEISFESEEGVGSVFRVQVPIETIP